MSISHTRSSPPSSSENLHDGPRIPEDETLDLIRNLSEGDDSSIEGGTVDASEASPDTPRLPDSVPDIVARVLSSPQREELIGLAEFLDPVKKKQLTLLFHTPIGEVKCPVDWCSNTPDRLSSTDQMIFIKLRSSEVMFSPATGAELEISFQGYAGRVKVTCLAPPQTIYPGVDLLCFLPQNVAVEKNGQLSVGVPSVVSGDPSTAVDGDEPVVEGEKAASMKISPSATPTPIRGLTVPSVIVDEYKDFDKTRPS